MLIADQWLEVHAYPRNGHLYVYSRDITERKIAEEKVIQSRAQAELQHRLLGQREMERQQIARDIHDGPLQELIGISMALHSEIEEAKDPDVAQNLMAIRASLQKQLGDLRDFAGELRPPALFQFGLRIAIRSHLEAYRKKHPELKIHFEAEKESDFAPPPIRMALYRIYQESLTNIAKHSEASEVWVRYTASPQAYELAIKDNGAGFILPDDWLILARKGHLGLVGLRERAEAFDGQVEINTQPGQGTQILVTIPVPESKEI